MEEEEDGGRGGGWRRRRILPPLIPLPLPIRILHHMVTVLIALKKNHQNLSRRTVSSDTRRIFVILNIVNYIVTSPLRFANFFSLMAIVLKSENLTLLFDPKFVTKTIYDG